jgi:murein DD-endopeptidase MepM/ murein hydrolase activator NlpD
MIDISSVPKEYKKTEGFVLGTPVRGRWDSTINKMRYPVTQLFGENYVNFYAKMGLKGHNGIDYSVASYKDGIAPVYATHDGWVISDKTLQSDTAGRYVKIMSDDVKLDGKVCRVETLYFHLDRCLVSRDLKDADSWYTSWFKKNKNFIKQGQIIGYTDNTGLYTTGSHLHFGMYPHWKQPDGTYVKTSFNGYDGAVDPMPYMYDFNVYEADLDRWYFNGFRLPNWQTALNFIKKYNH